MSDNLSYELYNKRSFVVRGDREKYGTIIRKLGGRWNARLKNGPGWTVPLEKEEELKKLTQGISNPPIKQDEKDKSKTQVVSTALFKYVPSISYNFKF